MRWGGGLGAILMADVHEARSLMKFAFGDEGSVCPR